MMPEHRNDLDEFLVKQEKIEEAEKAARKEREAAKNKTST